MHNAQLANIALDLLPSNSRKSTSIEKET